MTPNQTEIPAVVGAVWECVWEASVPKTGALREKIGRKYDSPMNFKPGGKFCHFCGAAPLARTHGIGRRKGIITLPKYPQKTTKSHRKPAPEEGKG